MGKLLIEFTEGVVFSKVDMGKLKGIVSTPIDTIVKKWGRNPLDIPRRCVFVISTNETEYFTDRTGNTRFFPVRSQKSISSGYMNIAINSSRRHGRELNRAKTGGTKR